MYSHGSSARAAAGKRGHGGRPYRAPPDRSHQPPKPPPLKACNCLVEIDVPAYAVAVACRDHSVFGGREAVQAMEQQVRSKFQCHLQIPGRNVAGQPVALVGSSVWDVLPACHYVMQQLVEGDGDDGTSNTNLSTRIHRDVKQSLPVVVGKWHKVTQPLGILLESDVWTIAVFNLESSTTNEKNLQIYMDNLTFYDASYRLQKFKSHDQYAFVVGSRVGVEKLLNEMGKDTNNPSSS